MDVISVLLMAIAGLIANRILEWLKNVPWLSDDEKSKIHGPLADFLAWLSSFIVGWIMAYGATLFGLSDSPPALVGLGAVGTSKVWFEGQMSIRALRSLALFTGIKNGK
jgi:hypothetical protein